MNLPQNHFLNPAIKPSSRFYIGLPVITGVSEEIGNDFLKVSDIIPPGTIIDSTFFTKLDINKLAANLKSRNTITTNTGIQLLGLGLTFGKDLYIFFDIIDRIDANLIFPRDLMKLYITGYDQFIGQTIDLSGMNIKGQYYREYGLGFSRNITDNLRIGAKVKLLSGIASMSMDNRALTLKVNNDFSQTVTADASLDVSGKETLDRIFKDNNIKVLSGDNLISKVDSTRGYNFDGCLYDFLRVPVSNAGISFDIGAVYTIGKLISLSASIRDLGFINWKKDLKSYNARNSFTLKGITLEDVVNDTYSIDEMVNSLVDTVKKSFIEDPSPESYRTKLPTGIAVGAAINLLPVLSLGVLSDSRIYAGSIKESFTMSANLYLGRLFSASMSYTIANYSYDNLGFGLAFRAGIAQIYLIADKIPLSWEKVYYGGEGGGNYSSIRIPQNMNLFNLNLGLNFSFGKPRITSKTDKPMILIQ